MTKVNVETRPEILSSAVFNSIRKGLDSRSAVWASLIAGLVYLIMLLILMPLVYNLGFWSPFGLIGSVAMGEKAISQSDSFRALVFIVALLILPTASIIYGYIGLSVLRPFHPLTALVGGTAFGLLLYLFDFYVLSIIFPWLSDFRGWVILLGHLLFGLILGVAYLALKRSREGYHLRGISRLFSS